MFHYHHDAAEASQYHPCADPTTAEVVQAIREDLWANGYRPVAVASHNANCRSPGKQPFLAEWQADARQTVPGCLGRGVFPDQQNTGILCDGLRAIDIDVDDAEVVQRLRRVVNEVLGPDAPVRARAGSPRVLILYRAAEGQPPKRKISAEAGQVEVLGHGQQFVADGIHKAGSPLHWERDRHPSTVPLNVLTIVTEDQIEEMLRQAASILGVDEQQNRDPAPATVATSDETFTIDDARAACEVIDPKGGDYDRWFRVGAAVFSVDAGADGQQVFNDWSRRAPNYDPRSVAAKWRSFGSSRLGSIGAGTLVHLAREGQPGWVSPSFTEARAVPLMRPVMAEASLEQRHFRLLTIDEIAVMPPPAWLLGNLLLHETAAAIYGPPRSFKSFLVLHMALTLAYGTSWGDQPVERVPVVYIAAEGAAGVGKRIAAWRAEYGVSDLPNSFFLIPQALDLSDAAEISALISDLKSAAPKLVVIDTLARCSGSVDENSSREMGGVINGALRIREELGTCVLLVHHTGKDLGRGMRGSNRLLGDLDTVIEVVRDDADLSARLVVRKQKDAEEAEGLWFNAQQVDLPLRPGHGPQTSLVVRQAHAPAAPTDNDLECIASAMVPGETSTLSQIISRVGWPRGETSYKRIEQAVPTTPVEVETEHGVRRIVRMLGKGRGSVTCMDVD
jgi:hypothetical protein